MNAGYSLPRGCALKTILREISQAQKLQDSTITGPLKLPETKAAPLLPGGWEDGVMGNYVWDHAAVLNADSSDGSTTI